MSVKKNFGGRKPSRKPEPGERVHLGFRVSPSLKDRVAKAARESTRSISQEAEYRLEQSFIMDEQDKEREAMRDLLSTLKAMLEHQQNELAALRAQVGQFGPLGLQAPEGTSGLLADNDGEKK